jgi:hypothetical protein
MGQDLMVAGAILLMLAFMLGFVHAVLATEEPRPWWARWAFWRRGGGSDAQRL